MDILELLNILSGAFPVRKKGMWPDLRESGSLRDVLNFMSVAGEPLDKELLKKHWDLCEKMRESKDMLASCWTLNRTESMLMWNAYTVSGHGVLLETTVGDFLKSLGLPSYFIMGHSVKYASFLQGKSYLEALFTKDVYYKGEKEYRFYFEPNGNGVFRINPEKLIGRVMLNPFLDRHSCRMIEELLVAKYPFLKGKICKSEIAVATMSK